MPALVYTACMLAVLLGGRLRAALRRPVAPTVKIAGVSVMSLASHPLSP